MNKFTMFSIKRLYDLGNDIWFMSNLLDYIILPYALIYIYFNRNTGKEQKGEEQ